MWSLSSTTRGSTGAPAGRLFGLLVFDAFMGRYSRIACRGCKVLQHRPSFATTEPWGYSLRMPDLENLGTELLGTDSDYRDATLAEVMECHPAFFGLDEPCNLGGWPDDVIVEIRTEHEDNDVLSIDCIVSFNEIVPSNCPDISTPYKHSLFLTVSVDKQSHEISVENSYDSADGDDFYYPRGDAS